MNMRSTLPRLLLTTLMLVALAQVASLTYNLSAEAAGAATCQIALTT